MAEKNKSKEQIIRTGLLRASRAHFLYVALLVAQIIVYDAWKVIVPEVVLGRWLAAATLMIVTTVVWYAMRSKDVSLHQATGMAYLLILADIALASVSVYSQRGMASRAVILYAIPVAVALVLQSRRALFATAALSVAAYSTAAVSYFILNFNEGYKIELYGEIAFYSAILFMLAGLSWNALRGPGKGIRPD